MLQHHAETSSRWRSSLGCVLDYYCTSCQYRSLRKSLLVQYSGKMVWYVVFVCSNTEFSGKSCVTVQQRVFRVVVSPVPSLVQGVSGASDLWAKLITSKRKLHSNQV